MLLLKLKQAKPNPNGLHLFRYNVPVCSWLRWLTLGREQRRISKARVFGSVAVASIYDRLYRKEAHFLLLFLEELWGAEETPSDYV